MTFEHEAFPALPRLAWLFEATETGRQRLLHGAGVAVRDDGFLEGCLAESQPGDPADATNIFGSGASKRGENWRFVTASHTHECLYLNRAPGGWSISNSLALLVAHHGIQPPWHSGYGARFASLCLGIDDYQRVLFRHARGEVMRIAYDNVELSPRGKVRLVRKPVPPAFRSFQEYVDHLREILRLSLESAQSAGYRPLATCSSGYDSACVAALAASLGCSEAVTVRHSRDGDSDSGKLIGELLGLSVAEFDRPRGDAFDDLADFLAPGMGGEDYPLSAFAPVLAGRVLVTGFHGGNLWSLSSTPNTVLARKDLSGSSLQEFRLRNDFIHMPVPVIGARRHPEIAAISRAPEMSAYTLRNSYDKPIPRRVLEEAGVPREYFGQHKRAASQLLFLGSGRLAPAAGRECEAAVPSRWVRAARYGPARIAWELRYEAHSRLHRRAPTSSAGRRLRQAIVHDWRIFEHSNPWAALEFLAGLLTVARRYQAALCHPREPCLEAVAGLP
jgi:hypothetical protein